MKQKVIMLYLLGILFQESFLYGAAAGGFQNFVQQMKSVGETIKEMGESFPTMFGVVPDGYTCSWEVINDSDKEIDIYYQNFISVMGGFFEVSDNSPSYSLHAIQPYHATFSYSLVSPTPIQQASTTSTTTTSPISAPPTSGFYSAIKYYFALFMGYSAAETSSTGGTMQGTNFYKEYQLNLGKKDDKSVSYYHVYTGRRFVHGKAVHMPMVEIAGVYNPSLTGDNAKGNIVFASNLGQIDPHATSQTSPAGSVYFYNTTSQPVNLSVKLKDGSKYIDILLEPLSYNMLSCPPDKTLNGSTLTFGGALLFKSIVVPLMTVQGNNYIFEIYQDEGQSSPNVAIQGFCPGNYDMCVGSNIRDISPQQAILWIESVAQKNFKTQAEKSAPDVSPTDYDLPGELWMVYQSPSVNHIKKASLGALTTLDFIRPTIADQVGYLYFVYVNTQDDTKAQMFIANFLQGKNGSVIKKQVISTINTPMDLYKVESSEKQKSLTGQTVNGQKADFFHGQKAVKSVGSGLSPVVFSNQLAQEILSGQVPANISCIQDVSTGLKGYLLGIDVFTPFAGQIAPISYYQLPPSTIVVDILAQIIEQYLQKNDSKTPPTTDQIAAQILGTPPYVLGWLQNYIKNPDSVQPLIISFLSQYSSPLFDKKSVLTNGGKQRIASFVNGLVSLANPPISYSQVSANLPAYIAFDGMSEKIAGAPFVSAGTLSNA